MGWLVDGIGDCKQDIAGWNSCLALHLMFEENRLFERQRHFLSCRPCLQVYELRMEAVLAELALLKAQCGCDYSLTLISPARQVEVMTSGEQTDRLNRPWHRFLLLAQLLPSLSLCRLHPPELVRLPHAVRCHAAVAGRAVWMV